MKLVNVPLNYGNCTRYLYDQKFSNIFSNTDIDIVTISALIIGGIYYLILHDKLSTFSEIELKKRI